MKRHAAAPVLVALSLALCAAVGHAEERVRIVNEGGIRDQWTLADGVKLAAPGYPAAFAERGDNVCVALGYAIQPDGTTSDFTLLRQWGTGGGEQEPQAGFWDAFAQAGAAALSQWRFKPRPEVTSPQPTFTVATLHFMGKQAGDVNELRSHCRVDDLAALLKANQEDPRDSRLRRDIERASRQYQSSGSIVENPGQPGRRP